MSAPEPIQPIHWFANKKVFITGGSSGIGKAAAEIIVKSGGSVQIAARGLERLDATLAELEALRISPDQVIARVSCDVSDPERMRDVASDAVAALGGIDVLINNAGVAHPATVADTPDEIYERMMRINYFGAVHTTRAFLPYFKEQRSGNIAMVSSLLGFMGIYGYTAYAASKYAMTGFADCLRQELLDHNVKLSVIFPGDTDTPQLHEENKIKPPETKAIAGNVKMMSAESVAKALLRGISKGRYHILAGFDSKFTYFMVRHFPGVVRWVIDRPLKKFRKENPAAQA